MSQANVTTIVAIKPRDPSVLRLGATERAAWLQTAFDAPCIVHTSSLVDGDISSGLMRAEIVLSTRSIADANERALLVARPGDQSLWRAWVEKSCVQGWCDVARDVAVSLDAG